MKSKPNKKKDLDLWADIEKSLSNINYIFLKHCRKRQKDRAITDIDVLDILENKPGRGRRRNKSKDTYEDGYEDWKYCIEGKDLDGDKIRMIISFIGEQLMLITVIHLDD